MGGENVTGEKKVDIREFVNDIRSGLNCSSLMDKYGLSLPGFLDALDRLVESNAISDEELRSFLPLEKQQITYGEMRELRRSPVHATLLVCDMADPASEGMIKNISNGGLLTEGIRSEVGEAKSFLILPKGFPSIGSFTLEAECRWTLRESETGASYSGFRIRSISEEALSELEKLLAVLHLREKKLGTKSREDLSIWRSTSEEVEVPTEIIEAESVFSSNVTDSGSFDIRMQVKQFGRLLNSFPIPCLLVDEGYRIVLANEYCYVLGSPPERFTGAPLLNFFPVDNQIVQSFFEQVFIQRKGIIFGGAMQVENRKIFVKICLRSIRSGAQRLVLAVVEDVTDEINACAETRSKAGQLGQAYQEVLGRLADAESTLVNRTDAVRLVMNSLDERIREERGQLALNLDFHLKPIVDRLKAEGGLSELGTALLQTLERALKEISPTSEHRTPRIYSLLTPREIEVCDLVLAGHGTKAIADILGLSVETVTTHRGKIRKKLGLARSDQSLSAWLRGRLELPLDRGGPKGVP
jgi:DNA-binding CsgD family transcriptional regulator